MGREDVSRADYSIWFLLNNRTSTRLAVGSGFGSAETTTGEGSWGNLRGGVEITYWVLFPHAWLRK